MTALLELKQKIKEIDGQYEMYILPVMRFVLALVYFLWINANMGYMSRLNNVFLVLILALICSILPSSAMMYIGFVLILVHSYALGIEIAAFMLVLILLMLIFFLRFSGEQNVTFVFTPLSFAFSLPALLPIGSGLMESSLSAIPAGCGVVMYYFIRFLRSQSTILVNPDLEMTDKLQIMADGLVQNWGMWIAVVAVVAVILLVHLIRTRSFDHAWRISIITGGVAYVFIMLVGSFGMNLNATVAMVPLLICTIAAVLLALVLEFFAFGGDYSRAERLEYEDDEYFYYVKAVPKASVATSERSIKKINAEPVREERKAEDNSGTYANPIFRQDEKPKRKKASPAADRKPRQAEKPAAKDIDCETLPAQSGSNRHTGDCPDFLLYLSVYGVDQVYPRLYSVEGNSDSTPFYFICICVENEHDPLDHQESFYYTSYQCSCYFPARTSENAGAAGTEEVYGFYFPFGCRQRGTGKVYR